MINLDDVQAVQNLDTKGLLSTLGQLPEQCEAAWCLAEQLELPKIGAVSNIVVTGLGVSAISGDLLRVFCGSRISVPVIVNRDYIMPEFVSADTLVFAAAYSGNTEATLSAYEEARSKNAYLIVIASGGRLTEKAVSDRITVIKLPDHMLPRLAMAQLFLPMLCVLYRLGLLEEMTGEIADMVSHLKIIREELKPEIPENQNPAKQLARLLYNRIPVFWGSAGITEVAAYRWKEIINESAKLPAFWNMLPDLDFSETLALKSHCDLQRQFFVVFLRDAYDHPMVQRRTEAIKEMIAENAAGSTDLNSSGSTTLARAFSLFYTGDYAGIYLALLCGSDPGC
jgi:glucose/mannose-6-phosphate isomerase